LETEEADEIEIRVLGKDGSYRWFSTRSFPMRDGKGRLERWVNIRSRVATVAELSASIAHELNQPLMAVLANAQATKRWLAAEPPNIEEAIASVERVIRDGRGADTTM
jgi:signal transduction histidine kinase